MHDDIAMLSDQLGAVQLQAVEVFSSSAQKALAHYMPAILKLANEAPADWLEWMGEACNLLQSALMAFNHSAEVPLWQCELAELKQAKYTDGMVEKLLKIFDKVEQSEGSPAGDMLAEFEKETH